MDSTMESYMHVLAYVWCMLYESMINVVYKLNASTRLRCRLIFSDGNLSGLHLNTPMQSSCTSVFTGLHLQTLSTSFVRWQMSRLVSDSVPVHPHHWLSAAPNSTVGDRAFPVAAARVWNSLPDLVTSAPSVAVFRSRLKTNLFNISYPSPLSLYSACAVTLSCFWTL